MEIRDGTCITYNWGGENVYGGSVKLVSGAKALRYCLRGHKEGFLALVKDVNGEIINSYSPPSPL